MTTSGSLCNIFVIVLFAFLPQPKSPAATKLNSDSVVSVVPNVYFTIPNVVNPNETDTTTINKKIFFLKELKLENKDILHSLCLMLCDLF